MLRIPVTRLLLVLIGAVMVAAILPPAGSGDAAFAQKQKKRSAGKRKGKPKSNLPPLRKPEDKLKFLAAIRSSMPTRSIGRNIKFDSNDLDDMLINRIGLGRESYSPLIEDETFVRRAYLDLTGQPPTAAVVKKFTADAAEDKRAALIDELLGTKEYARKWANYWQTVIFYNSAANKNRINPQALEDWLAEQFERGAAWDYIAAELISANGQDAEHGPDNFARACENQPTQLAAETARIFMGINIQCAECHDHPFDQWKRVQFHEMAAFFSRGKYFMPDQIDPDKKKEMNAVFLLGEKPPENLNANARRVAVAAYLIYNPKNYWFARAYVNRIWNELMGDGFYAVDSLGPDGEVVHQIVINRLAAVFRYREFDPHWVFRTIMNARVYAREIRDIDNDAELFTALRPARLRPDQVAASVEQAVGLNGPLRKEIEQTFRVDPSIPQRDLEGSIQQALLMMNNGTLQNRINNGPLKKRLVNIKQDSRLVDELYLSILARTPTEEEQSRSIKFLKKVRDRNVAVEDLIWVLINSTEFTTKR